MCGLHRKRVSMSFYIHYRVSHHETMFHRKIAVSSLISNTYSNERQLDETTDDADYGRNHNSEHIKMGRTNVIFVSDVDHHGQRQPTDGITVTNGHEQVSN